MYIWYLYGLLIIVVLVVVVVGMKCLFDIKIVFFID